MQRRRTTVFRPQGWGTGTKKSSASPSKPCLMRGADHRKTPPRDRNDARSTHRRAAASQDAAPRRGIGHAGAGVSARGARPSAWGTNDLSSRDRSPPTRVATVQPPGRTSCGLDDGLASGPARQRCQGADHRWRCATAAAARRRQRASVRNEGLGRRYPQQCEFHGFCVAGPSCADAGDTRRGRSRHSTLTYARA